MYKMLSIVVFLAVISFSIDQAAGIKCHQCSSEDTNNHECMKGDCSVSSGYCYKFVSNDGKTFEKGCASGTQNKCTTKAAMGTAMLRKITDKISKLESDSVACGCTNEDYCNGVVGHSRLQWLTAVVGCVIVAMAWWF